MLKPNSYTAVSGRLSSEYAHSSLHAHTLDLNKSHGSLPKMDRRGFDFLDILDHLLMESTASPSLLGRSQINQNNSINMAEYDSLKNRGSIQGSTRGLPMLLPHNYLLYNIKITSSPPKRHTFAYLPLYRSF